MSNPVNGGQPVRRCGHPRGGKGACKHVAGFKTEHQGWGHCWLHGGSTPNGIKYAARLRVEAERDKMVATGFYHADMADITPERVLLDEVRRAAGIVAWLQEMISQWRIAPESPEEELARLEGQDVPADGRQLLDRLETGKGTGLPTLGVVIQFDKGGTIAPTEANAWLRMYLDERQQAVRAAKMAIDAGIADRLVRMAEQQADAIVRVFQEYHRLAGLEFTPQRAQILGGLLRGIGGNALPGRVIDG